MRKKLIPISRPSLGKQEARKVTEAILSGWVTQGPRVQEFEKAFASYVGAKYATAVSNCTTALHLALLTIGVKPGDVVLTVSHSFIATANAIRYCGAEPVFIDIDPQTFNMSVPKLEQCLMEDCQFRFGKLFYKHVRRLRSKESAIQHLLSNMNDRCGRVAALLVVHQMGMPCELKRILPLAKKFHLPIVEDAACAVGSEICLKGRIWEKIGRPHGDIAAFSFHPRKIITCGDGGMLTTNNAAYDKRFRLLRQHGMSINDLARHRSKKIIEEQYLITGFNYRMTDIQAAVGLEQLKRIKIFINRRRSLADYYRRHLKSIAHLKMAEEFSDAHSTWQSFPVRLTGPLASRQRKIITALFRSGISVRKGIMNAHEESPYRPANWMLPESEKAHREVILLPCFNDMTFQECDECIRQIRKVCHVN